ncbi:hypothetical protein LTR50_005460 [Elasticomyces elasticus]|nr:hypothetical protein LTR50_005460 [Elasticomyces elasticus]
METADRSVSGRSGMFLSSLPDTVGFSYAQTPKRTASEAELQRPKPSTSTGTGVKRRASQACQSCRVRKVRCNVAKHGPPCTNCQMDELVCVVGESKRKKKRTTDGISPGSEGNINNEFLLPPGSAALSAGQTHELFSHPREHVLHPINEVTIASKTGTAPSNMWYSVQSPMQRTTSLSEGLPLAHGPTSPTARPPPALPAYIKPLPDRFEPDDITYLHNKGVLAIPDQELRNELLRRYAEYMHPFMPLLNLHELVRVVHQNDGVQSVSLLLFQAVMFAGVAHADLRLLEAAGYTNRREARRAFFNKTRLLYDLDYEDDPLALVQALLLMTYWRERPNARKETLHWIEIAVSLAQKIGLHRNPVDSVPQPWRQRLWKRIWWSAYMRDAQIALGSRTSTCIKDVDFDVPMLQLADFELDILPSVPSYVSADCKVVGDVEKQRQLALMCIENAKLCLRIGYILSVHHEVTSSKGSIRTAAMLFANQVEPGNDHEKASAEALKEWHDGLPDEARYVTPTLHDVDVGDSCLVVNRAFLHLAYYTALSALHQPQLLPSTRVSSRAPRPDAMCVSRNVVQLAATSITTIAGTLQSLGLVRYLPSPTITVLLPAIVFHLLDTLAPERYIRPTSLQDFGKCMQVMGELREMYAAADYSTAFLQAAIQKTEIGPVVALTDEDREERSAITAAQGPTGNGMLHMHLMSSGPGQGQIIPPSASQTVDVTTQPANGNASASNSLPSGDYVARRLTQPSLLPTDPPSDRPSNQRQQANLASYNPDASVFDASDTPNGPSPNMTTPSDSAIVADRVNGFEHDSDGNAAGLGTAEETFNVDDVGDYDGLNGGNGAFALDMDWMQGVGPDGLMLTREEEWQAVF